MHFTHADSMKASELAHLPALRLPAGVTCSAFAFRDGTSCAQPAAASARATRARAEARTLLTSAASGRNFKPPRAPEPQGPAERLKQLRPVALQLCGADPRNRRELRDRAGTAGCDLRKRRVVEDDIRGDLFSPRPLETPLFEREEGG